MSISTLHKGDDDDDDNNNNNNNNNNSFIHPFIRSFILLSVVRQMPSLLQSTACDLVLPLSFSNILSFP